VVYEGTDPYYLDNNLDTGQRYSYTVFTVDRASNYSRGESATLTPRSGDKSGAVALSVGQPTVTIPAQMNRPSFTHRFTRFLKDRDENTEVRELQRALNHLGFTTAQSGAGSLGSETNYFGTLTRLALQRFQCEHNIVCEGTAASTGFGTLGPKTRAKLNELLVGSTVQTTLPTSASQQATTAYTFTRNLKLGSRGEDVKRLQIFLNQQGFTVSETGAGAPGNETDYFGQKTHVALILFQDAHKAAILTPVGLSRGTGFFGPSTISRIHELEGRQGTGQQPTQTNAPSTNRAQQIANLQTQIQEALDKVKTLQEQLNQ
jgi:peptidoglycan hydrolase-like protein with peptidoglycan-binding domain